MKKRKEIKMENKIQAIENIQMDESNIIHTVSQMQEDLLKAFDEIDNEMNKIFKDMESYVVNQDEEIVLLPTGNPVLDVNICGGIPKNRMTYIWGPSGTGKTTLAFQIASSIFRQSILNKEQDKYVFIFIDSEEGQAKTWLDRIKIVLPYGKPIIPKSIESIKDILLILHKQFSTKNIIAIWDSVAATPPALITGRGDVARSVSNLLRELQFSNMNITFMVINQFREKQDLFASPEPPGGNFLRHKSHLTLFAKSVSKSKFFSKRPELGRNILYCVTKSRDGFSNIEFRMEMTQYSGFDAILGAIMAMKDLELYVKRRGPHRIEIPEVVNIEYLDNEANTITKTINTWDLVQENLVCKYEFQDIKDLYKFMLTQESINVWKAFSALYIYKIYRQHFLSDIEFEKFHKKLYNLLCSHYYTKNILDVIPTKINFDV